MSLCPESGGLSIASQLEKEISKEAPCQAYWERKWNQGRNFGKFDCDKRHFLTKLRMRLIRRGEEEAM